MHNFLADSSYYAAITAKCISATISQDTCQFFPAQFQRSVSFMLRNKSSALIMHFKLHRLESSSQYERYYQCNEQVSSTVECLLLHYFQVTLNKLRGCKLPSSSATDNELVKTTVTFFFLKIHKWKPQLMSFISTLYEMSHVACGCQALTSITKQRLQNNVHLLFHFLLTYTWVFKMSCVCFFWFQSPSFINMNRMVRNIHF